MRQRMMRPQQRRYLRQRRLQVSTPPVKVGLHNYSRCSSATPVASIGAGALSGWTTLFPRLQSLDASSAGIAWPPTLTLTPILFVNLRLDAQQVLGVDLVGDLVATQIDPDDAGQVARAHVAAARVFVPLSRIMRRLEFWLCTSHRPCLPTVGRFFNSTQRHNINNPPFGEKRL